MLSLVGINALVFVDCCCCCGWRNSEDEVIVARVHLLDNASDNFAVKQNVSLFSYTSLPNHNERCVCTVTSLSPVASSKG